MGEISPAAEWDKMGDVYYRRHEVYSMCWRSTDLSQYVVAVGADGGPVAIVRDDSKILLVSSNNTLPVVQIFNAAGHPHGSFLWNRGKLVAMGWTNKEVLLCVQEDGLCFQYSVQGNLLPNQFSMGRECKEDGVVMCKIWGDGVVCLTSGNQLFAVTSLAEPRPQQLAFLEVDDDAPPNCLAVIPPDVSSSGALEVLVAHGSTVLVVDADSCQDQRMQLGPVIHLAVSPDGSLLACYTLSGMLHVLNTTFTRNLSEFRSERPAPPKQVAWCGMHSVVLSWPSDDDNDGGGGFGSRRRGGRGGPGTSGAGGASSSSSDDDGGGEGGAEVIMVGPFGDWVSYGYDEEPHLVQERDGVRILTASKHEMLQRVPDSQVSIFSIGSTSPAAMLLDAREHFDRGSAKADDSLRATGQGLAAAVEECIDAAAHETSSVPRQRLLLRAAVYGRAFCQEFPRDRMADTCRALRVLNAVRHHETGVPLTYDQYQGLGAAALVDRLVGAHHHLLALRIAESLKLPTGSILLHWAGAKIAATASLPDAEVEALLVAKLKEGRPGVSYAAVASAAYRSGRPRLAALLLEHETCAGEQVPLLTSIGEGPKALANAVGSGDPDLIYMALFHLWKRAQGGEGGGGGEGAAEFYRLITARPLARDLFLAYCRAREPELAQTIYQTLGMHEAVADTLVIGAYRELGRPRGLGPLRPSDPPPKASDPEYMNVRPLPPSGPSRADRAAAASQGLARAARQYGDREHPFRAKAAREGAELLKIQEALEAESGRSLLGLSVSRTIYELVLSGRHKQADSLRKKMAVPEKRWWWLRVRALAEAEAWEEFELLAKEKKVPPIGHEPFVELALQHRSPHPVLGAAILRLPNSERKLELLMNNGFKREAEEMAEQSKDGEMVNRVRSMFTAGASRGLSTINSSMQQLRDNSTVERGISRAGNSLTSLQGAVSGALRGPRD